MNLINQIKRAMDSTYIKEAQDNFIKRILEKKVNLAAIPLGSGCLTEREDDQQFSDNLEFIFNEILEEFEKNPGESGVYIKRYPLIVALLPQGKQKRTGLYYYDDDKIYKIFLYITKEFIDKFNDKDYVQLIKIYKFTLLHELTHFWNDFSQQNHHKQLDNNFDDRVLKAKEFNAYFHQYRAYFLTLVKDTIKKDIDFEDVLGDSAQKFIDKFWDIFNKTCPEFYSKLRDDEKYNTKLLKRIYQLYFELQKYYLKETKQIEEEPK